MELFWDYPIGKKERLLVCSAVVKALDYGFSSHGLNSIGRGWFVTHMKNVSLCNDKFFFVWLAGQDGPVDLTHSSQKEVCILCQAHTTTS